MENPMEITPDTVYELRVYHLNDSMEATTLARFRDDTLRIFERFDMHGVAYWSPTDEPLADRTITYILRHKSREAANANWANFMADPEWKIIRAESEKGGKLIAKIDSTFMKLTDFSPKI
jgi:hypothetical protein